MIAILAVLVVLALPGCADERTFEAGELVDELNENGARLGLGASLSAGQDEVELFAVSFAGDVGTLAITEDADAGLGEYHRCEDAATLTCYRAANAVLYFELPAGDPQLAPLDAAIRALASD